MTSMAGPSTCLSCIVPADQRPTIDDPCQTFTIATYKFRLDQLSINSCFDSPSSSTPTKNLYHEKFIPKAYHRPPKQLLISTSHTFNMSSKDNTSSLQSLVDTATGYVQSGIAAVTGSAGDQVSSTNHSRSCLYSL